MESSGSTMYLQSRYQCTIMYLELHTPSTGASYLVSEVDISSVLDQHLHNPQIPLPSCSHEGCLLTLHGVQQCIAAVTLTVHQAYLNCPDKNSLVHHIK